MASKRQQIYIYQKKDDWLFNKSAPVGIQDVQSAYMNQRRKYSQGINILKYKDVFKQVYHILKEGDVQSQSLLSQVFGNAQEIIERELSEDKLITKLRLDENNGQTALTRLGWAKEEDMNSFYEQYGRDGFITYLHKIDGMMRSIVRAGNNIAKTFKGYGVTKLSDAKRVDNIVTNFQKFMKKLRLNPETFTKADLIQEVHHMGQVIGSHFLGGLDEWFGDVKNKISDFDELQNMINKLHTTKEITAIYTPKENQGAKHSKGQTKRSQVNKADNAIIFDFKSLVDDTKGSFYMGISEKAYDLEAMPWGNDSMSGDALKKRKGLVGNTSYKEIFYRVRNKKVENYFANEYIHSKGGIMNDPNDVVMKYITAKNATYAFSGGNLDQLCYFLHTPSYVVYIPDAISKLGEVARNDEYGYLRLTAIQNSPLAPNKKLPLKNGETPQEAAQRRSNQVYKSLKDSLTFSMGLGRKDFFELMLEVGNA